MKQLLILTVLLLVSWQTNAAFYSTGYLGQLLDSCNALPDTFNADSENFARVKDCGLSTGYILGVFDSLNVIADRSRCFPEAVRSEQVIAAVDHWIQKHPGSDLEPADKSVNFALNETWRCPD